MEEYLDIGFYSKNYLVKRVIRNDYWTIKGVEEGDIISFSVNSNIFSMNFHKNDYLCIDVSQPRQNISRGCSPKTLIDIFNDLELEELDG